MLVVDSLSVADEMMPAAVERSTSIGAVVMRGAVTAPVDTDARGATDRSPAAGMAAGPTEATTLLLLVFALALALTPSDVVGGADGISCAAPACATVASMPPLCVTLLTLADVLRTPPW